MSDSTGLESTREHGNCAARSIRAILVECAIRYVHGNIGSPVVSAIDCATVFIRAIALEGTASNDQAKRIAGDCAAFNSAIVGKASAGYRQVRCQLSTVVDAYGTALPRFPERRCSLVAEKVAVADGRVASWLVHLYGATTAYQSAIATE